MDERIRVVSAAIVWRPEGEPPRLLLGQRGPEQVYPLKWCTPGGKVEKGEADLDAIERELSEEMHLCVDAAECALLGSFSLAPPAVARALILTTYVVEGLSPAHKFSASSEIIGFGWFTAEEIQRLPLTPGDRAALPALVGLLGGKVERDPYELGYATAADEITRGCANTDMAKDRDLYLDNQDDRIAWDRGYDAACAAYRLGQDPWKLLATIGPVDSLLTVAALLERLDNGFVPRPDPRRREDRR